MTSPVFTYVFPTLLVVIMFGLGTGLTVADFARVLSAPRAVVVTLLCQVLVLPVLCFGLVVAFGLGPHLAVGMMLLAASPGGSKANLFSHLAGGDVALNITITAINSVLAIVTLPVVVTASVHHFLGGDAAVGLPVGKIILEIALLALLPVAVGMAVRRRAPAFARRIQRPLRTVTIVAIVVALGAAILPQLAGFLRGVVAVGLLSVVFCTLSLALGYVVPRLARIEHRQAVASAMEIGVHNTILAITVAVTVLHDPLAAVAPAMYGALCHIPVVAFIWLALRRARRSALTPA